MSVEEERKYTLRNIYKFHPIPIGKAVSVIRVPGVSRPFVEGRAVIQGIAIEPHTYFVLFLGDPVARKRVVLNEAQTDPKRFLNMMIDLWRAELSASCDVSDFFPDDR